MTDTDKTPPTLREAVASVVAEAQAEGPGSMADPKCHLRKVSVTVGYLQDLKAAHEAPGAYGSPDVAGLVEAAKAVVENVTSESTIYLDRLNDALVVDHLHPTPREPGTKVDAEFVDAVCEAIGTQDFGDARRTDVCLAVLEQAGKKPAPTDAERDPESDPVLKSQLDYYKEDLDQIASVLEPRDDEGTADAAVRTIADLRKQLDEAKAELAAQSDWERASGAAAIRAENAEKRAEKAEADLVEAAKDHTAALRRMSDQIDEARAEAANLRTAYAGLTKAARSEIAKAQDTHGVAMLRRLREWCHDGHPEALRSDDPVGEVVDEIDRLIAEAEKPAEPKTAKQRKAANLRRQADELDPPKDRDGDEVLRRWFNKARKGDGFVDLQGDAVAELCRRALGEGGAS